MRPIKVCHMTSAHPPEDIRIFHKECTTLAQSGYDVYLVERGGRYDKNGVSIIGAGDIPQGRIKRMSQGARKVYQIAMELDCDIYHIHDPELLPYGIKLHRQGKKVIFDSHELYREQIKDKTRIGPIIARIYRAYEKYALKRIDGVIFPCPIKGENPFKGLVNNFAYVNNVPLLSELYDQYDPAKKKGENIVCYLGAITNERGITNDIIASSVAGVKLVLAGKCHDSEYLDTITKMPEYKNVEYMGVLDRAGILDLLSRAKIGLATLLNVGQYDMIDTLPTKVYEYMAMGIPSIISNTPYNVKINDIFGFGICVDPSNPEEIAKAIERILSDPCLYKEMSENGRKAIKDVFNWEKEKENLLKLYQRVLS